LDATAERVLLPTILSEDGCFHANCGVSVEPAG
jgi:hypothetical protein